MKIAFHNRQRLIKADTASLGRLFERLLAIAGEELTGNPPAWLKKWQLRQIFAQGELSLVLVSNRAIRTINKDWRGIDKATDVLSFPLALTAPPWLQKPGKASQSDHSSQAGEPWVVGEVIISMQRAQEQAHDYGHSLERELAFLFVHGLLHVLAFDHTTGAEEKVMFGYQRRILEAAGIKRK